MSSPFVLPYHDRMRLAAEAGVCLATVERFLLGGNVRGPNMAALKKAAKALGLTLPARYR